MSFEQTVYYPPTSLKRHRHTRSGHSYDPSAADKLEFASRVDIPEETLKGPLRATLDFYQIRPKSHYRTGRYAGELKPNAPVYNTTRKDIDNLCKFVLDALNAKMYDDDSQIIELHSKKCYTDDRSTGGYIYIRFDSISDKNI